MLRRLHYGSFIFFLILTLYLEAGASSGIHIVHAVNGQQKLHPLEAAILILGPDCEACKRQVTEIKKNCAALSSQITFVGSGPRNKILLDYPQLKPQLWLLNKNTSDLKIRGTPTWFLGTSSQLGFLSCDQILKQIGFFKRL